MPGAGFKCRFLFCSLHLSLLMSVFIFKWLFRMKRKQKARGQVVMLGCWVWGWQVFPDGISAKGQPKVLCSDLGPGANITAIEPGPFDLDCAED